MFFPSVSKLEANLFQDALNPETHLALYLSNLKGKLKFPAAHNLKLSMLNSIFTFEAEKIIGNAQDKALMAMGEFFFKLFLVKRLRRFNRHLKDPEANIGLFKDVYLGSDIIKLVS